MVRGFRRRKPGVKPATDKRDTRPERREPTEKGKKETKLKRPGLGGWQRFFRRVSLPRRRIPWWIRTMSWGEIPWWGRAFIILGGIGIGLAIWFAIQPSCAPSPAYRLSVAVSPSDSGRVSLSPSERDYSEGARVTLTASALPDYEFVGWSGDASGTSPVVTVTMDSDKEVTANFRILSYSLTTSVSPPEGGTVSPSGGIYDIGSPVTLTASALPDYEFVGWSGDASGTSPVVTVTMDSDKEVTANFVATVQEISCIMPTGISGSVVTYSNELERGEIIEGFVELTGEYHSQDWSFDWTFEIIDPEGRNLDFWKGHWVKKNHHDFNFRAQYGGSYKIIARHNSRYDKSLIIKIRPMGWQ